MSTLREVEHAPTGKCEHQFDLDGEHFGFCGDATTVRFRLTGHRYTELCDRHAERFRDSGINYISESAINQLAKDITP